MFRFGLARLLAAALIFAPAAGVSAANEPSPVIHMLFEGNHLKLTKEGQELTYRFQRSVSHEKVLSGAFSDDIKLDIEKNKDGDKRDFAFKIFTGERARDPFLDHDREGNPLLLFYLDRSVNNFRSLAGGSLTYVKSRFMDALQKSVASEPTKIDVGGKSVDATKLTIYPYANDPNKAQMQGYEGARFEIVVSEAVPGYFVEMASIYESTEKASSRLEERISFVSGGEKK